ncbi:hypothetical protein [Chryseobacterium indologenes]|uniref:hypothetical protein n=1 Tax=Chryseobacterium indologenes TaxID=253 RepID=UPI0012DF85C3|nr:hypothetical protein [Chryseobacterium indologenes]MBF6644942.1 hypothetical protein [Chryseobacterium indologenes]QIX83297.1 hypothetical protein FOB56_19480 [Chryseobacterium indologenes]
MSRIHTDEAHISTGSANNRPLLSFPDNGGCTGNAGRSAPHEMPGVHKNQIAGI